MWDILKDIFKELFNPILHFLVNYLQVIVVVIPQATWDMSDENDTMEQRKEPVSQSAAIVVMNISGNAIEISDAGIRFKNGTELHLSDFNLPVKVEARNRHAFTLNSKTFEKLKSYGLEKIKYFYLEDPLFQRFKTKLSKKDRERLLTTYYLSSEQSVLGIKLKRSTPEGKS